MEKPRVLFTESPMLGGYTLSVRNDWNFKLKQVTISASEKEAYEKQFGDEIITYQEFFEWWKSLREIKN